MSLSVAGGFGLGDPFQPKPLGSYIPSLLGRGHPPARAAPPGRAAPRPLPWRSLLRPRRAAAAGMEMSGVGWRREHPSQLGAGEVGTRKGVSASLLLALPAGRRELHPLTLFSPGDVSSLETELVFTGFVCLWADGWRWSWHCPHQALWDPPHPMPDQTSPPSAASLGVLEPL